MSRHQSTDKARSGLGIVLVVCLVLVSLVLANVAISIELGGNDRDLHADNQRSVQAENPTNTPSSSGGRPTTDPTAAGDRSPTPSTGVSSTSTSGSEASTSSTTQADGPTTTPPGSSTSTTTAGSSTSSSSPGSSSSSTTTTRPPAPTTTVAPSSTTTTAGTQTWFDVSNAHRPLLTGHAGWGNMRIGSHAEPRESTSGPFPNIGTFRVFCHFSHQNFDDPLVFPGVQDATHLHSFFGNKNTRFNSTSSSIRNGGNSTCQGGIADRSAYWIPSVYDRTAKKLVRPTFAAVYYQSGFGNWVNPETIQPIPTGLMILAGRSSATPSNTVSQQVGYWGCFPQGGGAPRNTGPLIPTSCGSGEQVTLIVNFPQCWDGSRLDSSNHASHMAYPSWQGCPSSHPVVIPRIMLQVIFPVESHGIGGWGLSSDVYPVTERGGASIHADFVNGWNTDIMNRWLENCVRAVKDCERSELGGGEALTFGWGGSSNEPPLVLASMPAYETWDTSLLGTPDPVNPVTTVAENDFSIFCAINGHRFGWQDR